MPADPERKNPTVQETLSEGIRLLKAPCSEAYINTPELDAALLLAETLHTGRTELIVRGKEQINESDRGKFFALLSRRRKGECIAYILGHREFRGLAFTVNSNVLVPRPDTEILVEAALEYIDQIAKEAQGKKLSVLDLCTGSGAIAIALKNERPLLELCASDISGEALETAALNANRLLINFTTNCEPSVRHELVPSVRTRTIHLTQSDLFENIRGKFDIIVSNPPYIPSGELSALAPEVRREPRLALDGGEDGLELIKKIISGAPDFLNPRGALLLEAGPEQMPLIRTLLESNHFGDIRIHRDLAGRERVISGRR